MASNYNANDVDIAAATVVRNAKNIQALAKLASRKSIMTMASPGMFQYPLVVSNGIETDYLMAIAKGFQLTYASSVATGFSLNPIMDRSETPQLSDYVQKFHQNNPSFLNANIGPAQNMLGIANPTIESLGADNVEYTVESATISEDFSSRDLYLLSISAWDTVEESLDMESLNDMYKPYVRTERIIQDRIDTMKKSRYSKATEGKFLFGDGGNGILDNYTNGMKPANTAYPLRTGTDKPVVSSFKNEVVHNREMEAMEPTMVNVQIVAHGGAQRDQSVHNLTLGVKVMPRIISSNLMIASIVEAAQNSHAIFRFLKWTKGEQSTLDYVLGISSSKKKALEKNTKNEVKFLDQARKRKRIGGIGKFMKNEVLPIVTVVITAYEATKIKEICGLDLTDLREAVRLMNRYYFLAFGIYDTEQNTMQVLFDCDNDWSYTTIGNLKSSINKVSDVLNQNEVLKIYNRR